MKILVTGGAGFIGSNLTNKLVENHEVTVWDSLITGKIENLNSKAKFRKIEIEKEELDGDYDIIFHLAALARIQPSFIKPVDNAFINIMGTFKILDFARLKGSKVVYAGSSSFYHDIYANPYTFTKWQGEECCRLYSKVYNVSTVITRFFNVYGPKQMSEGAYATVMGIFEKQKMNNQPLTITGDGEQRRDFCHVSDIVDGLILLSKDTWKAETFNLGTGVNYSINEIAKMFNSKVVYLPKRPGEAQTTLADYSKMKKLGWEPKVNLKEYISCL